MLKQSYTYALLSLSLLISTGAYASLLKIKESSVHAPGKLGKVELFHDDYEGFRLLQNGQSRKIAKHSLSPELRAISSLKLAEYQNAAYLTVQEQSDGELSLKSHVRGEAGGLGGAAFGAWAGWALTHAVFQGTIFAVGGIVSAVTLNPGAGYATIAILEKTLAPVEVIVSTKVALAGGIAGGVATGPV